MLIRQSCCENDDSATDPNGFKQWWHSPVQSASGKFHPELIDASAEWHYIHFVDE